MKCLEIIRVRSIRNEPALNEILSSTAAVRQEGLKIGIYRQVRLQTDLSIHLFWDMKVAGPESSGLGLHLARTLKEFGLVDHTIWERLNGFTTI